MEATEQGQSFKPPQAVLKELPFTVDTWDPEIAGQGAVQQANEAGCACPCCRDALPY